MTVCEHDFTDVTEERRAALGPIKPWFQKILDAEPRIRRATASRLRLGTITLLKCSKCPIVRIENTVL